MDSLTVFGLSSSLPIHKTTNISTPGTTFPHSKPKSFQTHHQNVSNRKAKTSSCSLKIPSTTRTSNSLQTHLLLLKKASSSLMLQLSLALVTTPLSSFASETETIISSSSSDKISLESVLVSIDDFNNRNPFFVAGCTFIWLVVIPLAQEYVLKKYKFVSAIDAFRKLKDEPNSQLLDIRDNKSVDVLPSPNLKILSKSASQIQFVDGKEEGFVKKVLENFKDPRNTTLYVIDNFDGKSLQVAELLVKNGFKEAYAIKGGIRGKDGWQEIQETLLPPSVHVFAKKDNRKTKEQLETSDAEVSRKTTSNGNSPSVSNKTEAVKENGSTMSIQPTSQPNLKQQKMLSPYPNYPDLKPPSSPTPSKPSL
ncbi:hypothetical protein MKW94_013164 [Papaver nudicaule]|uniref:Rhodanese domain-containing protein n=1 Tax=Papaver nudicaule TaxID=74823 RepID=A0AA41VAW7_PAPNU|nr:hypothetical protein [Papaver nudicaule]